MKHPFISFIALTLTLVAVPVLCVKSFETKLMQVLGDELYKSEQVVFSQGEILGYTDEEDEYVPKIPDTGDIETEDAPLAEYVSVYCSDTGKVKNIELSKYLCGVLRGEMPPTYNVEALKAQAVAAYTYLVYQKENNFELKKEAHNGAVICTDPSHCKAYLSEEDARKSWGDAWYDKYDDKIESAVLETLYEVITYEEEVINAVFFSISSGMTEDAESVWGYRIPYLVSVNSDFDSAASGFTSSVTVSIDEYKDKLTSSYGCDFSEGTLHPSNINRSAAGGIITVTVGGKTLTGTQFRMLFGLRSSNIVLEFSENDVRFNVKGYGHGVGMSQYGANQLAEMGYTYDQILKYYYFGTELGIMDAFGQ